MSALREPSLEPEAEVKEMIPKLLPILILLLFASGASATTLHGTLLDADTDAAIVGVKVSLSGSSSTSWTDSNGKFDLTIPKDAGGELAFESADPCYYAEVGYNSPSSVEGYYLDTDELWVIIKIPSCGSDTIPSTGVDPAHPGPNGGNGGDGKTPGGITPTSTAGRWGGGILSAMAAVAALALATLFGIISTPPLIIVAIVALAAFIVGFVILPMLTEWGIPGLSWITEAMQDAGNVITNAFGFHFDTTYPKTVGDAFGDGIAEIADTIVNVFIDGIAEATGLSETMIWALIVIVGVFGLLILNNKSRYNT